jgi:hypothetical protein
MCVANSTVSNMGTVQKIRTNISLGRGDSSKIWVRLAAERRNQGGVCGITAKRRHRRKKGCPPSQRIDGERVKKGHWGEGPLPRHTYHSLAIASFCPSASSASRHIYI